MSADSDRRYWDRNAKNYDRSMAILGGPIPRMVELAAAAVGGKKVLEVAAGTGLVTRALSGVAEHVTATDYANEMVALVEERVRSEGLGNVQCERADIYALRYEPASFDAVVAANVLHLVPDLEKALSALRTVLRPGGRLIVPTYCHDETALSWVLSRVLAVTGFPGSRRFSASSLRRALDGAGLRVEREELLKGVIPILYVEGTFGG